MKNELKDLRFVLTQEMNKTMIEILVIQQMIDEKSYSNDEELKLMIRYKNNLSNQFTRDFKKHNKEQVKMYKDIVNK